MGIHFNSNSEFGFQKDGRYRFAKAKEGNSLYGSFRWITPEEYQNKNWFQKLFWKEVKDLNNQTAYINSRSLKKRIKEYHKSAASPSNEEKLLSLYNIKKTGADTLFHALESKMRIVRKKNREDRNLGGRLYALKFPNCNPSSSFHEVEHEITLLKNGQRKEALESIFHTAKASHQQLIKLPIQPTLPYKEKFLTSYYLLYFEAKKHPGTEDLQKEIENFLKELKAPSAEKIDEELKKLQKASNLTETFDYLKDYIQKIVKQLNGPNGQTAMTASDI